MQTLTGSSGAHTLNPGNWISDLVWGDHTLNPGNWISDLVWGDREGFLWENDAWAVLKGE